MSKDLSLSASVVVAHRHVLEYHGWTADTNAGKILPYKRDMSSSRTVLIAGESSERIFHSLHAVIDAGFSVLLADSAAQCVSLSAQYKPRAVLLDERLLKIDQWSIPELLHLVSAKSVVVLAAEEPEEWRQLPKFVSAVTPASTPPISSLSCERF